MFRVFNKFKLAKYYSVVYKKKTTKNKYGLVKFVLNKRFSDEEIEKNLFLRSLLLYYKNYQIRKIYLSNCLDNIIYYGKDMRLFNKKLVNNNIEEIYLKIMKEMQEGFDEIIISNKNDYDDVINMLKFLCIYPYVKVTIEGNEK